MFEFEANHRSFEAQNLAEEAQHAGTSKISASRTRPHELLFSNDTQTRTERFSLFQANGFFPFAAFGVPSDIC